MNYLWLPLFFVLIGFYFVNGEIGCKDENNNPVDWFYVYKVPKNKFTKNELVKNGVAYMYITPQTERKGWILSEKSINDTTSIPGRTLKDLYENTQILSFIYNDQPPDNDKKTSEDKETAQINSDSQRAVKVERVKRNTVDVETRGRIKTTGGGHTKGVILSDAKAGIWLIHSVPKYPPIPDKSVQNVRYSYPSTATKFAQNFLCLTLNSSQINEVGAQMKYNEPKILFNRIPSSLMNSFPNIIDVINRKTVKSPPWYRVVNITTSNRRKFTSFAKSANFGDDLYEGLVAQTLATDLLVESWQNGPGAMKSNCSYKYKVNNIEKIAFAANGIAFSSHSDHSKWAVSVPLDNKECRRCGRKSYWICVGDINRASSQENRGGGTVCSNDADIWMHYNKLINAIEGCDGMIDERYFI